jgi:metallophosphoesterase (TIGR00282 family)
MKILFIGDIVGKGGREILSKYLTTIREEESIDFVIGNGENAAGGMGITPKIAEELLDFGIDVITSGNHIWKSKGISEFIDKDQRVLRPANYPEGVPGKGWEIYEAPGRESIAVLNLEGRIFMRNLECPFRAAVHALKKIKKKTQLIVVDFHAEASSEKMALGWYLDGKVSSVVGTHTHVQTADERILPNGTGYITDVGMTGPTDSVIGIKKEIAIERFLTQMPLPFNVAQEGLEIQGVILELDSRTGWTCKINRLKLHEEDIKKRVER